MMSPAPALRLHLPTQTCPGQTPPRFPAGAAGSPLATGAAGVQARSWLEVANLGAAKCE